MSSSEKSSFWFETAEGFEEKYNEALEERLSKLDDVLKRKGSACKPITKAGLLSLFITMLILLIMLSISWFNGPVGA